MNSVTKKEETSITLKMKDKVPSHHLPIMVKTPKKLAAYEPLSVVLQRNHLVNRGSYSDLRRQTQT
jgi:hypothetical protein